MFADPLVLVSTYANSATLVNLYSGTGYVERAYVCTGRGPTSSTYRYTIGTSHWVDLLISRQIGKRSRYTVRFTETELVADPINSELNQQKTSTVYIVADIGVLGTGTSWASMCNALSRFIVDPFDGAPALDSVIAGQT